MTPVNRRLLLEADRSSLSSHVGIGKAMTEMACLDLFPPEE